MVDSVRGRLGKRILAGALTLALVGVGSAFSAEAQPTIGPHAGYDFTWEEFSIGVQSRIPFANLGSHAKAAVYPNIDLFVFDEDVKRVGIDADLIFPFRLDDVPISPYAGLGLGITITTTEFTDDAVFDLNILGGLSFLTGTLVEPYVEVEWQAFGSDTAALFVGVDFVIDVGSDEEAVPVEDEELYPEDLDE